MNDLDPLRLFFVAIVAALISAVAWQMVKWGAPAHTVTKPPVVASTRKLCGKLVKECSLSRQVKVPTCTEVAARRKVERDFGNPLEQDECKAIKEAFSNECAPGCFFDYSSVIYIPGSLNFTFSPTPDEAGQCGSTATQSFVISGNCMKQQDQPAAAQR